MIRNYERYELEDASREGMKLAQQIQKDKAEEKCKTKFYGEKLDELENREGGFYKNCVNQDKFTMFKRFIHDLSPNDNYCGYQVFERYKRCLMKG